MAEAPQPPPWGSAHSFRSPWLMSTAQLSQTPCESLSSLPTVRPREQSQRQLWEAAPRALFLHLLLPGSVGGTGSRHRAAGAPGSPKHSCPHPPATSQAGETNTGVETGAQTPQRMRIGWIRSGQTPSLFLCAPLGSRGQARGDTGTPPVLHESQSYGGNAWALFIPSVRNSLGFGSTGLAQHPWDGNTGMSRTQSQPQQEGSTSPELRFSITLSLPHPPWSKELLQPKPPAHQQLPKALG